MPTSKVPSGHPDAEPLRILLLNQHFQPEAAASAQRMTDLADDVAAHHDVTVVVGRPCYDPAAANAPRPPADHLRLLQVPSTAYRRDRTLPRVINYLSYLVLALVRALPLPRPDVVITGTDPPLAGLIGLLISRWHRARFIHLLWDIHPDVALRAGLLRDGIAARVWTFINRQVIRRASLVIVPTAAMRSTAIGHRADPARVHVISHWEDSSIVTRDPKVNPFSVAHGLADRFVVMYSGNIGLTQGIDALIDLALRLGDLPDVLLVIAGDGASRRRLQHRAKVAGLTNVRFFPYQPRERMRELLAAADILVAPMLPGLSSCMLPSKVYTFMAAGRPVVAALDQASDIARMIEDVGCGLVVPPSDAAALESAVRRLHADAARRTAMGMKARAAAEQMYARSVVTPHYLRLLETYAHGAVPAASSELHVKTEL